MPLYFETPSFRLEYEVDSCNLYGKAKPEAVVTTARIAIEAKRHPTVIGTVAPTATTIHTTRAILRTFRIRLMNTTIIAIPIATPFPYIAYHII